MYLLTEKFNRICGGQTVHPNSVQKMRVAKGLSQEELAKMLGISASAVSLWENGKRRMSDEYLGSMVEIFQHSPMCILGAMEMDVRFANRRDSL